MQTWMRPWGSSPVRRHTSESGRVFQKGLLSTRAGLESDKNQSFSAKDRFPYFHVPFVHVFSLISFEQVSFARLKARSKSAGLVTVPPDVADSDQINQTYTKAEGHNTRSYEVL